ncbi:hypothetical protein DL96DRAFT_976035 [Flagelloscypha sp. PMI_526]|nr:hypothetical protein DL96DRAFT_976035 [Flagelloscypha sp. PMI_526]
MDFGLPLGVFPGVDLNDAQGRSTIALALREFLDAHSGSANGLSNEFSEQDEIIEKLPRLTENDIPDKDDSCPICFTPWLAILAEEDTVMAMDSPAYPVEYSGVTKLSQEGQCNHIFCRRDILKWIEDSHNSCPLCRQPLLKKPESTNSEPMPDSERDGAAALQETLEETLNAANANNNTETDPATRFRETMERLLPTLVQAQGTQGTDDEELQHVLSLLSSALGEVGPQVPSSLQSPFGGLSFFGLRPGGVNLREQEDDDRSEFAGMYS